MAVKLAPNVIPTHDANGDPYNGALLFTYQAGSSTKLATYTDSTGNTAQANPIVLNSKGMPDNWPWLTEGQTYKFVLAPSTDTDPPASPILTVDNISGINDANLTIDQWVSSGLTPTYVSATQFTLSGDQTSEFHVGRRLKTTNSGGTIYSTITASAYTSLTTVTVVNDSGSLDAGLSVVAYGILTTTNPSMPKVVLVDGTTATTQSASDNSTKVATTAYVDTAVSGQFVDYTTNVADGTARTVAGWNASGDPAELVHPMFPLVAPTAVASTPTNIDFVLSTLDVFGQDAKNTYLIRFYGIRPSADDVELRCTISSDGGSTWLAGTTYGSSLVGYNANNTYTFNRVDAGAYGIVLGGSGATDGQGNASGENGMLDIIVTNMNTGASVVPFVQAKSCFWSAGGKFMSMQGGFSNSTAADYDALRFTYESGTFTDNGYYAVYKIANSFV